MTNKKILLDGKWLHGILIYLVIVLLKMVNEWIETYNNNWGNKLYSKHFDLIFCVRMVNKIKRLCTQIFREF